MIARKPIRTQTGTAVAEMAMVELILLVFLIVLLICTMPVWPYARAWGPHPFRAIMLVFVIVLVLSMIRLL